MLEMEINLKSSNPKFSRKDKTFIIRNFEGQHFQSEQGQTHCHEFAHKNSINPART